MTKGLYKPHFYWCTWQKRWKCHWNPAGRPSFFGRGDTPKSAWRDMQECIHRLGYVA